ncbi:MAG: hypothetical protein ACM3PT_08380 [Deltaproteobacteria bacterium]
MDDTYNDESLIKYIYAETDIAERFEIEDAIENNSQLNKAFQKLYYAYKSLPRVLFRPSEKVVGNILAFSGNYSV